MRILYLGEIDVGQTALMRMRALQRLGHDVRGINTIAPWRRAAWLSRQWQRRLNRGGIVNEINKQVRSAAAEFNPQLVWADKQEYLLVETLETLRHGGARLLHFTPDPYFSVEWKRTRLMDEAMRSFDVLVYCKSYERRQYEATGRQSIYMPLGFCDEVHRPLPSEGAQWSCQVGFLGGWEPRRQRMLRAVAASGVDLKFRGGHWDFLQDGHWTLRRRIVLGQLAAGERVRIHRDRLLADCWQGEEVYGDDYARALSGAKIGLGFLRQVCPDQHTTRTFEIPACGSLLLADRTDEHQAFFEEGTEAEFFASPDELLDKVTFYCANEPARRRLAARGYERCLRGRYAYVHRLRTVLESIGNE